MQRRKSGNVVDKSFVNGHKLVEHKPAGRVLKPLRFAGCRVNNTRRLPTPRWGLASRMQA